MATKFAGTDWNTVLRMLGGGAMLGAGTGAAVTFANHLRELQEGAKPPGGGDDTLYLDLPGKRPQPKQASSNGNNATTFAYSGLAGMAGTALAYNAVRSIYNRQRKKELDNELAQAHHVYLQGNADAKSASQYSIPTKMVGTGYLAFLMTALGSAVVANKMLQKRFPPIQSPTVGQPKKIVVRTVDPETRQPYPKDEVSPDAMEGVVRSQMADTKMASHNDVVTVVSALASGRVSEVKELIKSAGVDGMLAAVKGANWRNTNPVERNLAITLLCTDGLLKEALAPMVAAEFFKSATWTFSILPTLNDHQREHLTGLVESSTQAVREAALAPLMSKLAASDESIKKAEELSISPLKTLFVAGALTSILDKPKTQNGDVEEQARRDTAEGQDSPSQHHGGIALETDDDNATEFVKKHMAEIDKARAGQ